LKWQFVFLPFEGKNQITADFAEAPGDRKGERSRKRLQNFFHLLNLSYSKHPKNARERREKGGSCPPSLL
jgi:hypothetical protein